MALIRNRHGVSVSSHPEHLHHFIPEVVDDFDGDAAGWGLGEGAGRVAVQGGPGFLVDFGFEGGFQRLIGIIGAEEVGVADEKAFLVVVGVNEPAGDAVGPVRAYLSGLRMEHVYAVDGDLTEVASG